MTDALCGIVFLDGTSWVRRLTPRQPAATVPPRQSGWSVAGLYLKLGVEHILLGIDHLLFVLALLIITRGTAAGEDGDRHSRCAQHHAALATLGYVHVPTAPVEAAIARASFVAVEIVRLRQGAKADSESAVDRGVRVRPSYARAGFAGALSEVGLPEGRPIGAVVLQRRGRDRPALFIATALWLFYWVGAFAFRPALGRLGGTLRHRQRRHVLGARNVSPHFDWWHHARLKENAHDENVVATLFSPA